MNYWAKFYLEQNHLQIKIKERLKKLNEIEDKR